MLRRSAPEQVLLAQTPAKFLIPPALQVELAEHLGAQVLDASACFVMPGLVDMHVHVTGGGGEAGPASRTPESSLSAFLDAGITTVVGVMGTDCYTRRPVRFS